MFVSGVEARTAVVSENLVVRDPVSYRSRISPGRVAVRSLVDGKVLTYGEMDERIARCASLLTALLGEKVPGATVASLGRNSIDMLVLGYACQRINCLFVPLNWRLQPLELAAIVQDCGAQLVVYDNDFSSAAEQLIGDKSQLKAIPFEGGPDSLDARIALEEPRTHMPASENDPIILLYTSGTTGTPKGVILTRANLFYSALNFLFVGEVTTDSVTFCDLPFFHTIGLVAIARTTLMMGATLVISDRFIPERTIECLNNREIGVSHYFAVPQMATILRSQPNYMPDRMKLLKAIFMGGAPLPPPLVESYLRDGVALVNGYGMSEAGTVMHMPLDKDAIANRHGSVGFAAPFIEAKIVGENGLPCAGGEVGELWIKGPSVSPGYWNKPEQTAAAFVDGWFRTGDLFSCDEDGFHLLADRLKDMYISGGENVYPAEVEAAILSLEGVAEVSVVGLPDEKWGEVGAAFIVARAGHTLTTDAVLDHCKARLATYKRPQRVHFLDAIPRNASGKALKHILRDVVRAETS